MASADGAVMEVEQGTVIDGGQDIAVGDDNRQFGRLRQQSQRAGGSETFRFVNIFDRGAERGAVAEMIHDHFGPVVHRDEDVPKALLHDVADDGFQQRPSADIEHRLGPLARQRAEPLAKPARHDENGIWIVRRLDQLVERLDADQLTVAIEQRKLPDGFLPHQVQPLLARQCRRRRHRGAVHDFGGQPRKLHAAQQAAANVAVGHDADEAAGAIQHQRNLNAAALDRGNGFAYRRVRSDNGFAPGFHAFWTLQPCLCPRPLPREPRYIAAANRGVNPRRRLRQASIPAAQFELRPAPAAP